MGDPLWSLSRLLTNPLFMSAVRYVYAGRTLADTAHPETGADGHGVAFDEVREQQFAGLQRLDIDTCGNGNLDVRGWQGDSVRLRATVRARAQTDTAARELAAQVTVAIEGGRVRATGPRMSHAQQWVVDFEVNAPRTVSLALRTLNGSIAVEGTTRLARLDTVNGAIVLTRVDGDVRARTVNGFAHVALEGTRWNGRGLNVASGNGGVTLLVPDGYSADLEAQTGNGNLRVEIPLSERGLVGPRRVLRATLGGGGAPLRLATVNGNMTVTRTAVSGR